ncbi:MAG: hypothetical protein IJT33_06560 [Campylobacter sp.]|nr:hypothetical protein [Campylobacter sp.]
MSKINPSEYYFYDVFGGGGAASFGAYAKGFNVIYNELNPNIYAFMDYLITRLKSGKRSQFGILDDEFYQFFTREKAHEIWRGDDAVLKGFLIFFYSFGTKTKFSYFCSPQKEIFKKHGHNLVVFASHEAAQFWDARYQTTLYSAMRKRFENMSWRAARRIFSPITLKLEAIKVANLQDDFKNFSLDDMLNLKQTDLCKIIDEKRPNLPKKHYKNSGKDLKSLEQLEQLERLEQLELNTKPKFIKTSNLDYKRVKFDATSDKSKIIIYLDPPYINTADYGTNFNHNEFYSWIRDLKAKGFKNIYMSEYQAPSDFKEIWHKNVNSKLQSAHSQKSATERLFKA